MDGRVESEPGQRWRSATRTASTSVPRSRAENKSGPSFSIWPAALFDSQPEKLLVRSHFSSRINQLRHQIQASMCNVFVWRQKDVSVVLPEMDKLQR